MVQGTGEARQVESVRSVGFQGSGELLRDMAERILLRSFEVERRFVSAGWRDPESLFHAAAAMSRVQSRPGISDRQTMCAVPRRWNVIHQEFPQGRGAAGAGDEQHPPDSTQRASESQARAGWFTPPCDPYLRAIYTVGQCEDLTPTERLALLALWRYLGSDRKCVGPSLLAGWLGIHRTHGKTVLWRLQKKGYIGSSGTAGRGVQPLATRWITDKSQLPRVKKRGPQDNRSERGPQDNRAAAKSSRKRGPQSTADLGVRRTDPGRSAPPATTVVSASGEETPENPDTPELFNIAEHMARGAADA